MKIELNSRSIDIYLSHYLYMTALKLGLLTYLAIHLDVRYGAYTVLLKSFVRESFSFSEISDDLSIPSLGKTMDL